MMAATVRPLPTCLAVTCQTGERCVGSLFTVSRAGEEDGWRHEKMGDGERGSSWASKPNEIFHSSNENTGGRGEDDEGRRWQLRRTRYLRSKTCVYTHSHNFLLAYWRLYTRRGSSVVLHAWLCWVLLTGNGEWWRRLRSRTSNGLRNNHRHTDESPRSSRLHVNLDIKNVGLRFEDGPK